MRDRKEPVGASSFAKTDMNLFTLKPIIFFDKFTLILDPPGLKKTNQANINIHIQFQSDVWNTNIKLRHYTDSGSGDNIAHAYNSDSSHAQTIFLTTIIGLDVGDSVSTF